MIAIVPLAGPDFDQPDLPHLKPLMPVDGMPLIRRALESRVWWRSGELQPSDLIFVLRQTPHTAGFAAWIAETYPGAQTLILPGLTEGALLSAMAGASVVRDFTSPLVIDLVDILYESECRQSVAARFGGPHAPDAIVPVFPADHPEYSYAAVDATHPAGTRIRRTAEKEVISGWASAGTYLFGSTTLFLQAAARSLAGGRTNTVRGSFFICPVINDLIAGGGRAHIEKVKLVRSVSLDLKAASKNAGPVAV